MDKVEICGCPESLALRAEVAVLHRAMERIAGFPYDHNREWEKGTGHLSTIARKALLEAHEVLALKGA